MYKELKNLLKRNSVLMSVGPHLRRTMKNLREGAQKGATISVRESKYIRILVRVENVTADFVEGVIVSVRDDRIWDQNNHNWNEGDKIKVPEWAIECIYGDSIN